MSGTEPDAVVGEESSDQEGHTEIGGLVMSEGEHADDTVVRIGDFASLMATRYC